jgi:hypothetical protein
MRAGKDPVAAGRFFRMAMEKFEAALDTLPSSAETLSARAEVFVRLIESEYHNLSKVKFFVDHPHIQQVWLCTHTLSCHSLVADPLSFLPLVGRGCTRVASGCTTPRSTYLVLLLLCCDALGERLLLACDQGRLAQCGHSLSVRAVLGEV